MKPACLSPQESAVLYTGVHPLAMSGVVAMLLRKAAPQTGFIFSRGFGDAERLYEDITFYNRLSGWPVGREPELVILPELPDVGDEHPRSFDLECDRLAALTRLLEQRRGPKGNRPLWVITTPGGFFHPVPPPDALSAREVRLKVNDVVSFRGLTDRLGHELGYSFEVVCEMPGQYAVRGGIIDVYPINGHAPVRLDFFGDQLDSLRTYDPTTQRSLDKLDAVIIAAAMTSGGQARDRHILDYIPAEAVTWVFLDPARLEESAPVRFEVLEIPGASLATFQDLFDRRRGRDQWLALAEFETDQPLIPEKTKRYGIYTEGLAAYRTIPLDDTFGADRMQLELEARKRFLAQLARWQDQGYAVTISAHNEGDEEQLRRLLEENAGAIRGLKPCFAHGVLEQGFRLEAEGVLELPFTTEGTSGKWVLVAGDEVAGRFRHRPAGLRRRKLPQRAQVDQLLDFSELAEGDYLVHAAHGICRFRGLARMEVRGRNEEVISLEFADEVTLHLPLPEAHLLSRYVGLSKMRPKLGRVGSGQWEKHRRAAEQATLDLAGQLLKLQASRDSQPGHAFAPDNDWQRQFESAFEYTETVDQHRAILEAKLDMEKQRPMDRLLCGDVGFGKTEIALRAAFKAVMDNRQVAILVPTTVLAQQHFNTFKQRMANFPVAVEMVSRFRSKQQVDNILAQTAAGKVDILIGTHRLLSDDVYLPRMGLLVIDEEHRFGVRHKEKIKMLRENIDVLTMSATPIPRTLYMALTGARDLSVIETAPQDRLPIQTIVKSYSAELVKETILFEVKRGGQVFYLHNRVETIESVALRLQDMMPDVRIAIGHGQMPEMMLEKIMTRFVKGDYDVLICTTIIESGLDIPNCNTIIIEGADRFGLAQLYQLRGRVGRFNRQAYCYLLLHRHARMLDQARKRLQAIRQYNQLGAGFKIAMRDLELRGAGNILGSQQSGYIASVGFDLYCQLLRQSVARLKGEPGALRIRATVRLDFVSSGEGENTPALVDKGYVVLKDAEMENTHVHPVEAGLPQSYINEARLRIDFYRRLALADGMAGVNEIEETMKDRFGKLPSPAQALLAVTHIRVLAEQAGLLTVETEGNLLKCLRASGKSDDYVKIGTRFPRLTARTAILRLQEIRQYLKRLVSDIK
ncbi:MAG: transcription-repair coupling factor [Verrucomicrobiota bacterium]|nr:transcription-repair coupling factor [Verrucomicrobiota bacterium]